MKDVRAPGVMPVPFIVSIAPYITTTIIGRVDAAFSPPKNIPATFCGNQNQMTQADKTQRDHKSQEKLTACVSPKFNVSSTFSEYRSIS